MLKVGVTLALDTEVLKTLRNSPALLKVPVPPIPSPVTLGSLRMKIAPFRLLKMPLMVSGEQQPGTVLVTVPLLSHVRLAPRMPEATFTVDPLAVVSVEADVPSSVAFPVQLNVPLFGMAIAPEPVNVPPDSVRVVGNIFPLNVAVPALIFTVPV